MLDFLMFFLNHNYTQQHLDKNKQHPVTSGRFLKLVKKSIKLAEKIVSFFLNFRFKLQKTIKITVYHLHPLIFFNNSWSYGQNIVFLGFLGSINPKMKSECS